MNLVIGATGLLGGEIVRRLSTTGQSVRALVRPTSDRAKVEHLESIKAEIVYGDLKDRSSLERACQGVTAVISTASGLLSQQAGDSIQTVDLQGQLSLIDAAQAAGVKQFIFISFPSIDIAYPLQAAKQRVEQSLQASGLTYTILHPTFFMEVWLSPVLGFDVANKAVQIYGAGQNKISWISYRDVAAFAVAALDAPETRNATIELGGPTALSPLEVVQVFKSRTGQPLTVQHVPKETLQAQLASATDPVQQSFAGLMLSYAHGKVIDMQDTQRWHPRRLTSVLEYAEQAISEEQE